jgi:hypothetical protein
MLGYSIMSTTPSLSMLSRFQSMPPPVFSSTSCIDCSYLQSYEKQKKRSLDNYQFYISHLILIPFFTSYTLPLLNTLCIKISFSDNVLYLSPHFRFSSFSFKVKI